MPVLSPQNDPMGVAIIDFLTRGTDQPLRVCSPMFDDDEIPVAHLFRTYLQMPAIEQKALDLARGHVLDVGAGAGCHSLVLQERGIDVSAIDISPLSVEAMRLRGVRHAVLQDFFLVESTYDTVLMLMNGIGMTGTLRALPRFFRHLDRLLAPGGQLLCDSSDIRYVFTDDDGQVDLPHNGYYGELRYQMRYGQVVGKPFPWLYVDFDTLSRCATEAGFCAERIADGPHFDCLARIVRQ